MRWMPGFVATLAALIAVTAPLRAAPSPETPQHFIARLFALYRTDSPYWKAAPGSAAAARYERDYYDPTWSKLVDDNSTLAGKGGGEDLDYDPVCQCQDSGGHYVYLAGAPAAGGLFNVKVKTTDQSDTAPWTIVLKAEAGGWRVYDVIDGAGDLRVWVARHNDCMRRIDPHDDAALTKCFGDP
jgi:hypothetical protein